MTAVLKNPVERTRFMKFLVVGAVGAVVDFGVMNILTHTFSIVLVVAGTISFTCAVASNFTWNRFWTYPESRSKPLLRQLGMFFAVNLAGVIIRLPILSYLEPVLLRALHGIQAIAAHSEVLARNFTLAIAVGIVMMWNFFVNRYWTYNDIDD